MLNAQKKGKPQHATHPRIADREVNHENAIKAKGLYIENSCLAIDGESLAHIVKLKSQEEIVS